MQTNYSSCNVPRYAQSIVIVEGRNDVRHVHGAHCSRCAMAAVRTIAQSWQSVNFTNGAERSADGTYSITLKGE